MAHAFKKDGFMVIITKDPYETSESFNDRGNFIVSQKPKTKAELDEAIVYSRIYVNCDRTGCEYEKEIMDKLAKMKEN